MVIIIKRRRDADRLTWDDDVHVDKNRIIFYNITIFYNTLNQMAVEL